jgi:tetratricopeptide (TPR) repeat protein
LSSVSINRAATLRNAEQLLRQAQLDGAIAEYVKIVEEFPRDWTTANTLGDAYVRAGQIDKAIEQFVRIADGLSDEGFLPKAAALYKKTIRLKPDLEPVLWKAAEIAATQGILADARAHLKAIEGRRTQAGDEAGAVRARIRMDTLDRANYSARRAAAAARATLGDVSDAVRDLLTIALELGDLQRFKEAVEALSEAGRLAPDDADVRRRLFDVHVDSGDVARAREFATTSDQLRQLADALERSGGGDEAFELRGELARLDSGDDPAGRLALVSMEIRSGRSDEAAAIALELLQKHPAWRERILAVALDAAAECTAAAFRSAQLVADSHVVDGEWSVAADAMEAFAERAPQHLPARERLAEICVDGVLESRLVPALTRLADAYLAAGLGDAACLAAEELVAREPWEHANIDRFRRALVLLQTPDPDKIIAERLGGQAPFLSTVLNPDDLPGGDARSAAPADGAADTVRSLPAADVAPDLEDVFVQLRGEVSRTSILQTAESEYRRALTLREAGDLDGCVEALLVASRAPSLRFVAGSLLGRVYRQRGQITDAVDWFERAAQAPAPTPAEYHEVLFELFDGLEASGDVSRALAVGLALQTDAGSYRDVDERIDRLAKVQARG